MEIEECIIDGLLRVVVKPNAKRTSILEIKDKIPLIALAAPADKNKANLELIKFLSKLLKKRVLIKSGLKNNKKIIIIKK